MSSVMTEFEVEHEMVLELDDGTELRGVGASEVEAMQRLAEAIQVYLESLP